MTRHHLGLMVKSMTGAAAHDLSATPAKPNIPMGPQAKPPKPPSLTKLPGESAQQAVDRHIEAHDSHLRSLESDYGMHVPRGTASIMMGLPGSGKSHYLKGHHLSHGVHMHVDVDALKPLATGEHDFKYPSHYPDSHPTLGGQPHPLAGQAIKETYDESDPVHVVAAHPVSKRLEEHLFDKASARRIPMALDTTGGNHKKWGERIDHLKDEKGYHHVSLVNVRVSRETSMKRNAGRKRVVPQAIIDGTFAEHAPDYPGNHGKTPFQHLKAKVDKTHVVDHEPAEAQAKRAAQGWHSFLSSGGSMAKADNGVDYPALHKRLADQYLGEAERLHASGQEGSPSREAAMHLATTHVRLAAAHRAAATDPEKAKQELEGAYSSRLSAAKAMFEGGIDWRPHLSDEHIHHSEAACMDKINAAHAASRNMAKADQFTQMAIGLFRSR